ncbi:hypothetical protein ONE63_008702 [Megalurothrips usitatus]|uniref:Uncharacterized protein n=1 Tax=Megalurothrips usitatus TaxID=439358 RepID=A0AAV7XM07_9NEOP|nr:hypothetical protein ONE63_008702 [Megalurothrips usitatus]
MSTKSADSKRGKSLTLVNLDIIAVRHPITAPIPSERVKMNMKSPSALKNASVSKLPDPDWYRSA